MRRINKFKKIAAAVMAAVLAITAIPVMGLTSANAEDAAASTAYIVNANDLDATALAGATDTAMTENKKVGNDDYFELQSVQAEGKYKIKIGTPTGVEATAADWTFGDTAFAQSIYLTGGAKAGFNSIKFTVPEGKVARVTVLAAAKSDGASQITYYELSNNNAQVKVEGADLAYKEVKKFVIDDLKAGSYALGGTNGAHIYYMEVKYVDKEVFVAETDLTHEAETKITKDTTVGSNNFMTIMAVGDKNKLSLHTTGSEAVYEDAKYTKYINLGGGLKSTGQAGIKVVLTETSTIKVLAQAKSDKESILYLFDSKGNKVEFNDTTLVLGELKVFTLANVPAGTYYFGGTNGGYIYEMSVEKVDTKVLDAFDATTVETLKAFPTNDKGEGVMAANTTVGTDNFFTLISTGSKTKYITYAEGSELKDGDTKYATTLRLDGGAKASGQSCFKVTLTEMAKITIISGGKNDKDSEWEYVPVGGSTFTKFGDPLTKGEVSEVSAMDLLPGQYYIGTTQGADIVKVIVEYDSTEKPVTPWEEVAAPTITEVKVSEETGNFLVTFTGVADKYEGAESLVISMQRNGHEVSSTKITSNKSKVAEIVPYANGDYTFTITAVRSGEAFKVSAPVEYKDFKLMLKQPKFRMLQSMGGGDVYVDWIANEYCKNYDVYYKLSTDADFTKAGTTEEAAYTIKGLKAGSTYTIKVIGNEDGTTRTTEWTADVAVTEKKADKDWNAAITGSSQTATITVTDAAGKSTALGFDVSDSSKDKTQVKDAADIANTAGKVEFANKGGGKISDSEDGFHYYYTMVNPNTENFKMSATFKIVNPTGYDGQSGFGIIASDVLGVNMFGEGTYVHKNFNSVGTYYYGISSKGMATVPSFRYVSGHTNADPSVVPEAGQRVNTTKKFTGDVAIEAGKSYTFTLEKTNEKWIGTFNGESYDITDTAILSAQEDGSFAVGVFAVRCMGVEVSDIKFETSESTGVTKVVKDTKVTPDTRIYSTGTVGTPDYEVIYASNVAGTLIVTGPDGTSKTATMKADSVARLTVKLAEGKNTVDTTFIPDKDADLTSYVDIKKSVTVEYKKVGNPGESIWVSATGKSTGDGSKGSPMDLATAVKYAQPGQTIVMKDGNYTKSVTIDRSVSGTADKMITLMAENTGKAVFTDGAGLTVVGSYWHVYGIKAVGSSGVGIQVGGNYNIIEMCVTQACANSGLQISRTQGSATNAQGIEGLLWPSYNLIKNCESFDNMDAGKNDADGFAAKLTCGEGNKFYGCSSHNNIDDGWDLFAKVISGPIGSVTIENCIAYDNGVLTDGSEKTLGEGNGFKLGGGYLKGGHVLKNSIAFNNLGKGITSNSCPDVKVLNCISYGNNLNTGDGYNIGLNTSTANEKEWVVEGVISMNKKANTKYEDLIPFNLINDKNYIYNGLASYNSLGEEAVDKWFVSVDVAKKPTRSENGTINMAGLLELTADSQTARPGVGAVLDVTSDAAISVAPVIPAKSVSNSIIPSGDDKSAVTGVDKSDDVVIEDSTGNAVTEEDIYMEVVDADAAAVTKLEKALEDLDVKIDGDVKAKFFDITLKDKTGKNLTMKGGKLFVTFAYPEGTAQTSHNFKVYHMNGDKLEEVKIECAEDGITMEATSFSNYVLVYEPVVITPAGDDNNALPFAIAMMASMAALAGAAYYYKKRRIFG